MHSVASFIWSGLLVSGRIYGFSGECFLCMILVQRYFLCTQRFVEDWHDCRSETVLVHSVETLLLISFLFRGSFCVFSGYMFAIDKLVSEGLLQEAEVGWWLTLLWLTLLLMKMNEELVIFECSNLIELIAKMDAVTLTSCHWSNAWKMDEKHCRWQFWRLKRMTN